MHKLISMSKIKSPHSTITGAMVLEVHDFPISAGNIRSVLMAHSLMDVMILSTYLVRGKDGMP